MSDHEEDNTNSNKELPKKTRKKVASKNVVEQNVEMEKSISDTELDDIIQRKESKKKATKKAPVKKIDKKSKRKGNKQEDNMMVAYKLEAEAKVVEVKSKTNDRKTLNLRMSPRYLKRVLDSLTTAQHKHLKQMGFGEFQGNFNFYYVPVKSLKEKNLFDPVTAKWRGMVQEIVSHDNRINISQLELFLCKLSKADWLFDIGFLSLFFSIFGQGNKDGTINERLIPYLDETDKIHQMD
ncbi:hypothetical protein Tco_1269337 [Tanacetum coccineum]